MLQLNDDEDQRSLFRAESASELFDSLPPPPSYDALAALDPGEEKDVVYGSGSGNFHVVDDEDSSDDDDDDDDPNQTSAITATNDESRWCCRIFKKLWRDTLYIARIVANVDDLWDSPGPPNTARRNKALVLFWFFVAASSYAGERSTFKLLIDRVSCYRLVAVQIVCLLHAILSSGVTDFRRSLGIPLVDVAVMSVMDTITMMGMFLAGAKVPPTLTVLLVQATIPLTAFLSPQRHLLEPSHVTGGLILLLAVALALVPAVLSLVHPDWFLYADAIPIRTAVNTLWYAGTSLCAAASQLYKEGIFLQYKQPVNMELLNLILSVFQFILASVVSPLAYVLQGLGAQNEDDWTHEYPASEFGDNVMDGLACFFPFDNNTITHNDTAHNDHPIYPDTPNCTYAWLLAVLHVVSTLAIAVAVDKITHAGATQVMFRGLSAGIILAALGMHVYDMHTPVFNYGPAVDALNLVCLMLLMVGSEVYHHRSATLPNSTFETMPLAGPVVWGE